MYAYILGKGSDFAKCRKMPMHPVYRFFMVTSTLNAFICNLVGCRSVFVYVSVCVHLP